MLVASEMAPAVGRSQLEQMLDAIRLRDALPAGAPPALPSRPTSRGRLPSSRYRLLAPQFKGSEKREEAFSKMPGLESCEGSSPERPVLLSDDSAVDHVLMRIASGAYDRDRADDEIERGATTLQSFIRAEIARQQYEFMLMRCKAIIVIQKHVRWWISKKQNDVQRKTVIVQSVVRGWLARRQLLVLKSLELRKPSEVEVNGDQCKDLLEIKDNKKDPPQVCPSVLADLERRVLQAEEALRIKDEENLRLQQQLQLFETRWSDSETRMKSMEVAWQEQLAALQMNIAAAKKSLVADDTSREERLDNLPNPHQFVPEDINLTDTHTSEGTLVKSPRATSRSDATPAKPTRASDARLSRNFDGTRNAVSNLVGEFEQRKQAFENDAGFLVDVKLGKSYSSMDPDEELKKLKSRVAVWRKDYKARLKETRASLKKLGHSGSGKTQRKWWQVSCVR